MEFPTIFVIKFLSGMSLLRKKIGNSSFAVQGAIYISRKCLTYYHAICQRCKQMHQTKWFFRLPSFCHFGLPLFQKIQYTPLSILDFVQKLMLTHRTELTLIKSRGPILPVMSSETRSVCVKHNLNTRRWLVNALVTWHVSYKIMTLHKGVPTC